MEVPRDEKLKALRQVLYNLAAPFRPSGEKSEADGRRILGYLGIEDPTDEELRELRFILD